MTIGSRDGTTTGAGGPISGRRWSPLPIIAHLVAIALGIWVGLTVMSALDLPEVGAEARAAGEERAARDQRTAAEAAAEECREAVRDGVGETTAIPEETRTAMERECEGGSALDPEGLCYAAVRETTTVGPERSEAITACEQAFGD